MDRWHFIVHKLPTEYIVVSIHQTKKFGHKLLHEVVLIGNYFLAQPRTSNAITNIDTHPKYR